jgi:hypothetical protein
MSSQTGLTNRLNGVSCLLIKLEGVGVFSSVELTDGLEAVRLREGLSVTKVVGTHRG